MNTLNVQNFYENFDFEKVITNPPKLIQDFLDGEIVFIQDYVKPEKIILEVGCGYGRLLQVLSKYSKEVIGIDFSNKLLDQAKKNLHNFDNVSVKYMQADNISFPDDFFDYVLCLDASFGNMPNIELNVLKEMKRVCKKNGEIIISVFSEKAKVAQIENYTRIGLTNIQDNGVAVTTAEGFYSRRFTKEDLTDLFSSLDLNCEIKSICPINYIAIAKKS